MAPQKSISFDVIGTCFHFDQAIQVLQDRLKVKDAQALCFSWFYAAQRDFTYLSILGSYTPIAAVLKATLPRACSIVAAPKPSNDDVAAVMKAMTSLGAREGLKECWEGLRADGWDVYAVTNGGLATSIGYYRLAGIEVDEEHVVSCDAIKVAKPDPRVYERTNEHLSAKGCEGKRWFVAAHAWDLIAARKAGFKTAYLDFEEGDPVPELFGQFDVHAGSMTELMKKMKALV